MSSLDEELSELRRAEIAEQEIFERLSTHHTVLLTKKENIESEMKLLLDEQERLLREIEANEKHQEVVAKNMENIETNIFTIESKQRDMNPTQVATQMTPQQTHSQFFEGDISQTGEDKFLSEAASCQQRERDERQLQQQQRQKKQLQQQQQQQQQQLPFYQNLVGGSGVEVIAVGGRSTPTSKGDKDNLEGSETQMSEDHIFDEIQSQTQTSSSNNDHGDGKNWLKGGRNTKTNESNCNKSGNSKVNATLEFQFEKGSKLKRQKSITKNGCGAIGIGESSVRGAMDNFLNRSNGDDNNSGFQIFTPSAPSSISSNAEDPLISTLKRVFRLTNFRLNQREIIVDTHVKKRDLFVVMRTGGGKSLTYQMPAVLENYAFTKKASKLTVVITPLISLMEDQVNQMNSFLPRSAESLYSEMGKNKMNGVWRGERRERERAKRNRKFPQ